MAHQRTGPFVRESTLMAIITTEHALYFKLVPWHKVRGPVGPWKMNEIIRKFNILIIILEKTGPINAEPSLSSQGRQSFGGQ